MSVQRIVEDSPAIDLQAEAQHTSGEIETPVSHLYLLSLCNTHISTVVNYIFSFLNV